MLEFNNILWLNTYIIYFQYLSKDHVSKNINSKILASIANKYKCTHYIIIYLIQQFAKNFHIEKL